MAFYVCIIRNATHWKSPQGATMDPFVFFSHSSSVFSMEMIIIIFIFSPFVSSENNFIR